MRFDLRLLALALLLPVRPASAQEASVFYPPQLVANARANVAQYPWAAEMQKSVVSAAQPWMAMSDEELWNLMFGATITRSWMVWSSGHCPACDNGVPMYNWRINYFAHPWKLQCPHCQEFFPKNDFRAYYLSGLDEQGVFQHELADKSLLFNTEHPDPNDPLHLFGVDDGNGYAEGDKRWRFIGTYLVYGQWKQAIVDGVKRLAEAYLVTGDATYAHRAMVLLDRIADLYPTFDFKSQAIMYEGPADAGYVSTWHDACEEVRELALAYDQVREAVQEDTALVEFLSGQAAKCKLDNPKAGIADIHRNIRDRILGDTIENARRIQSNYPRQIVALIVLKAVLGWPDNRDEVMGMMDPMIEQATAVDGVTGEKGLAGYSSYTVQGLGEFLAFWDRAQPGFLEELVARHPRLRETFRFFIDTWCSAGGEPAHRYYPQTGDTGGFATPVSVYVGLLLPQSRGEDGLIHIDTPTEPSLFSFLWRLTEVTGDPAYAQVAHLANGGKLAGLPYDLFNTAPAAFQQRLEQTIATHGPEPQTSSVNKQQWRLAVLRSGSGANARALWLDYDAGGGHAHYDAMNLGLFAKGLDLMPDLGYPPVQYGGWSGPKFGWYVATASHNTVVIDGNSQAKGDGQTLLWGEGQGLSLIQAEAPGPANAQQYDRTVALVDLDDANSYVLDLFRVVGGSEHAKFQHSHFGALNTDDHVLQPAAEYGRGTQMRNFQQLLELDGTTPAQPGWAVDWQIADRRDLLPEGRQVRLRYTDFTVEAEACTAEGWVSVGGISGNEEAWVPRVMVRRRGEAPLASTFVSLIEPYEQQPGIASARRLDVQTVSGEAFPASNVALEVTLAAGGRDLFLSLDPQNPLAFQGHVAVQPEWDLRTDARACWVRLDAQGRVRSLALWQGEQLSLGGIELRLQGKTDFIQISLEGGAPTVIAGDPAQLGEVKARP
jgi:hypothetical protein